MSRCKHRTLHIKGFNALGVTVECLECDEAFDVPDAAVNEKYYLFVHVSPQGPQGDLSMLIHQKVIER